MRRILGGRARLLHLATDIYVTWLAFKDPRTPRTAKVAVFLFTFYVLNPLDVIPEPIPILGLLDDAAAVWLAITVMSQLAPEPVLEAAERYAEQSDSVRSVLRLVAVLIGLILIVWLAVCAGLALFIAGVL